MPPNQYQYVNVHSCKWDKNLPLGRHPHKCASTCPFLGNHVLTKQKITLALSITIGNSAIIAANSLVVKDVTPYSIVGGNPAKPIKNRFNDYTFDAMKALQWWKYSVQDLAEMDVTNPHVFCHQLTSRIAEGRIQEFKPSKINFEDIMRTLREETEST